MLYIVTKLVTEGQQKAFSIIGASEDKKRAASIAAEVYKDYNKNASFQNIEMITEWLATRQNYSFRKDKDHSDILLPSRASLVHSVQHYLYWFL